MLLSLPIWKEDPSKLLVITPTPMMTSPKKKKNICGAGESLQQVSFTQDHGDQKQKNSASQDRQGKVKPWV